MFSFFSITDNAAGATKAKRIGKLERIVVPQLQPDELDRFKYFMEVLTAALDSNESTYGPYDLVVAKSSVASALVLSSLKNPKTDFSVGWGPATTQDMLDLNAVQVPLYRGWLGARVLVTTSEKLPIFQNVTTVDHLKKLSIAAVRDSADAELLKAAGIPVATGGRKAELFEMLARGKVDAVITSVSEALLDTASSKDRPTRFILESKLLISYPTDYFFYLPKVKNGISTRIQEGMKTISKNGKALAIWNRNYKDDLQKAALSNRKVIKVTNGTISDEISKAIESQSIPGM